MIKSIVFYVYSDKFGPNLLQSEFVRHEEAISFLNSLNGKKGISAARLISAKSTGELYVINADNLN